MGSLAHASLGGGVTAGVYKYGLPAGFCSGLVMLTVFSYMFTVCSGNFVLPFCISSLFVVMVI